ncbi:unnamed protein product [Amoebophrya sp. A120]|nr:unnamed protein product [Amoebophrya sp. A120]|eukprot:GSA120T00003033001.1
MSGECALLGEQWLKFGPQVTRYVKRLKGEREKFLVAQEDFSREKEDWAQRLSLQQNAFEEAILKCWELATRIEDLEADANEFQREKLRLVKRLDQEKAEFCEHEQKRRDERTLALREENTKLRDALEDREATIAKQQKEIENLQTQVSHSQRAKERLEDSGKKLVSDLELQVQRRTESYRQATLKLIAALAECSLHVMKEDELEEIVGKCPLDEKTDEDFNQVLDVCCDEYARFRYSAPERLRQLVASKQDGTVAELLQELVWKPRKMKLDLKSLLGSAPGAIKLLQSPEDMAALRDLLLAGR